MSQDTRETESEKRVPNTLNKLWSLVSWSQLQAEIVIIDPKPY